MLKFRNILRHFVGSRSSIGRFPVYFLAALVPATALYAQSDYATPYQFTTLAGSAGASGTSNGTGGNARFSFARGVALDNAGNLYVADTGNDTIRKITSGGVVTTLAGTAGVSGSADATGSTAQFNEPSGVAVDSEGNLYVADTGNDTIRKITSGGVVTTLAGNPGFASYADGSGNAARFNSPYGVAVDTAGNVYVADSLNFVIRKITSSGVVTTLAGTAGASGSVDGTGGAARFGGPTGLAVDIAGNIYVTDGSIRKITSNGVVTTLAGMAGVTGFTDGTGSAAMFGGPYGIAVDSSGNLFVGDNQNNEIRKITSSGVVTTLAGSVSLGRGAVDGTGRSALFNSPTGVAVDASDNICVADLGNYTIRYGVPVPPALASAPTANVYVGQAFSYTTTFSNSPTSYSASGLPGGLTINTATGVISGAATVAGSYPITLGATNGLANGSGTLNLDVIVGTPGAPTAVSGVAGNGQATVSFAPPTNTGEYTITGYTVTATPSSGLPITMSGSASPIVVTGLTNGFAYIFNVAAINSAGTGPESLPFVASTPTFPITYSTNTLAMLVGATGPNGVALDPSGNVYVTAGNALEKITSAGAVTLFAGNLTTPGSADGTGAAASFKNPTGIATDSSGNVYVADSGNNSIRKVTALGTVTTLAGLVQGNADGLGLAAQFDNPIAVAVDGSGNVYVAEPGDLRKIAPNGETSTILLGSALNLVTGITSGSVTFPPTYVFNGVAVDSAGVPYGGVAISIPFGDGDFPKNLVSVVKVTNVGAYTEIFQVQDTASALAPASDDGSLAIDGNGIVYVLSNNQLFQGTNSILSLNDFNVAGGTNYPNAISAGPSGQIYLANSPTQSVIVITPVGSIPTITAQPIGGTIAFGASIKLSIVASGTPSPSYQWQLDGVSIAGATSSSYVASTPGTYTAVISSGAGVVKSSTAVLTAATRLANISSRALVGTNANVEIAGFVITGPPGTTEQVLIRGAGPSLSPFGISGFLAQPILTLYDASGKQLATNTGWNTASNAANIASAFTATGAFAFPLDSADSAILTNLSPGSYTAQIVGLNGSTGVALAEVYEVKSGDPELINISTRAFVGSGTSVEIGGFVVSGSQSGKVLIRAIGPTLSQFGVAGALAQPSLSVVNSSGTVIASNTVWSTNANASAIATEMTAVGAFPLPSGSSDSVLLLTLPPGAYTAIVSGVNAASGVALVEVYQAP